jgi:hypothetical protein
VLLSVDIMGLHLSATYVSMPVGSLPQSALLKLKMLKYVVGAKRSWSKFGCLIAATSSPVNNRSLRRRSRAVSLANVPRRIAVNSEDCATPIRDASTIQQKEVEINIIKGKEAGKRNEAYTTEEGHDNTDEDR